eukprot:CAMPEP_0170459614 /NCGR_PEP_ID=MMETSP0123-20130129/6247_1 /TAXON_ID=182087 /ORGANISM="Favella ehrenbergii, Strain Fehren 1" /LENGTH=76 /DNA_ID=CAMNT_0010724265 /DNA_START=249 /DNA_END=479 /DNA_ORIENTATION=-
MKEQKKLSTSVERSLEEVDELSESLKEDIEDFYEGPGFMVGHEPCLTASMGAFLQPLLAIQASCERLNDLVQSDVN